MKVAITGRNGYIGKEIANSLTEKGHELLAVPRQILYGDHEKLAEFISNTEAVINLAGAPILQRWSSRNKIIIYNSRVLTTKKLCEAINSLPKATRPKTFIGMSAIGIYQAYTAHDETSSRFATNFVGRVTMDWEDASLCLNNLTRRVIFRTGIVLGKESQTIKNMLPVFKLGFGSWIGKGDQAFAFIHIDDVVKAFTDAILIPQYAGIFNLVAPGTITNKQFSKQLAKTLKRPAIFPVPAILLKTFLGEASGLLTTGPTVVPKRLLNMGFPFQHPNIESALTQITS